MSITGCKLEKIFCYTQYNIVEVPPLPREQNGAECWGRVTFDPVMRQMKYYNPLPLASIWIGFITGCSDPVIFPTRD